MHNIEDEDKLLKNILVSGCQCYIVHEFCKLVLQPLRFWFLFQTASEVISLEVSKRSHPRFVCVSVCICVCLSIFYLFPDHWRNRNETFRGRWHQHLDDYYILKNILLLSKFLNYLWKPCTSLNTGCTYSYLPSTGDTVTYLLPPFLPPTYLLPLFLPSTYLLPPSSYLTFYSYR